MLSNQIRQCCYMIGEDLGITGSKAIQDFPANDSQAKQIIFLSKLLTDLENYDKEKYVVRKKYVISMLNEKNLKIH